MKPRILVHLVVCTIGIVSVGFVVRQHRELAGLHREQPRLSVRNASGSDQPADGRSSAPDAAGISLAVGSPSPELLRLRSEVSQLLARQRNLAGASNENAQLRAQIAAGSTNAPAVLPPGYVLRSKAQRVGFATPDNTIESFLWAAQNHDLTNLMQALTPESVKFVQERLEQEGEEHLLEFWHLPGMRILDRQPQADGSIVLKLEFLPEIPDSVEQLRLRLIDGQWKLDLR